MRKRGSRVRDRHRRGRQVVVWGAAVLVALQLTASVLLDYCWPHVRFPQAGARWQDWQTLTHSPEIVFFGSSRFEVIRPELVEEDLARCFSPAPRSFNSSLPAGDPISAERFLEKVFAVGYRPKLLILEVSPETVARRSDWLECQALHVLTWSDWPVYLPHLVRYTHFTRVLSSRLVPLHRYRYEIRKQTRNAVLAWLGLGASTVPAATPNPPPPAMGSAAPAPSTSAAECNLRPPVPPSWAKAPVHDAGAIRYVRRALRDYEVGGVEPAALARLLERCRRHEIAVVLVGVPVSSEHRAHYAPHIEQMFVEHMQHLVGAYGCRFVDLRHRVPDCCFKDHHHVSYEGSDFLSRLIAWEVAVPAWRALGHQRTRPVY